MKYEQFTKKSRLYEYGENKEFETKEEANKQLEKLENEIITQMSLEGLYSLIEKREIKDDGKALVLEITVKFPRLFE